MPNLPYFPFFPDDWISSLTIKELSPKEESCYLRLLCLQWKIEDQRLPNDIPLIRKWLNRRFPEQIISKVIQKCFQFEFNSYRNQRLFEEYLKVKVLHDRACKAAEKRWNDHAQASDKHMQGSIDQASDNHNHNHNQIESKDSTVRKKREPSPPKLSDQEWLEKLKANPAYKGIDVDREYHKCSEWCDVHNRKFTRRTFVNWLNRADKPLTGGGNGSNRQGNKATGKYAGVGVKCSVDDP